MDIKRELNKCGEFTFFHANALDNAEKLLTQKHKENQIFDLVVTDMNFPIQNSTPDISDAGFQLIDSIIELSDSVPIIICSSQKFHTGISNVLGSIRYGKNTDLVQEFRNLLQNI